MKQRTKPFRQGFRLWLLAIGVVMAGIILASTARAEVVYTQTYITISGNGLLKIDLNHDGIIDVTIVSSGGSHLCAGTGPGSYGWVYALPATGNGTVASGNYALALNSGIRVSSSNSFYYAEGLMMQYSSCLWPPHSNYGAWLSATNHYLGLKFKISGQTHYGWARLTVTAGKFGPVVMLTGYAYETVAGQGITTGQTSGP